jgi:hypothetical protein
MLRVFSRMRSPLTLLVACLQLVLAVRAPAAVMGVQAVDMTTTSLASNAHDHHHHAEPPATADASADAPGDTPDSHEGHDGGGCHGGLPCCASTVPAAEVRDVCASQRLLTDIAPSAVGFDFAAERVALRQPPSTAPPALG